MISDSMSQIIQITQDLVEIPSTADRPDQLQKIVDYVEAFFAGAEHLFTTRYQDADKPSIAISTRNPDTDPTYLEPDILLLGHLDVVPAAPELFTVTKKDGRLYGRGVCDMKGECAVLLSLMQSIQQAIRKGQDAPHITLLLTTDEEIGGRHGAQYLVEQIGYRAKLAIVPDSGTKPTELVLMSKGIAHLKLTAKGATAHGSRPWLGKNAIDLLIQDYLRIYKEFHHDIHAEDDWRSTCSIGQIGGGVAINQVPDEAWCFLDIRFTEQDTLESILQRAQACAPHCQVEVQASGDPCATHKDHPLVQLYEEVIQTTLNVTTEHTVACGGHDGRFLSAMGIPVITTRPISGDQHSPNEWIDVESLLQFEFILKEYIESSLRFFAKQ